MTAGKPGLWEIVLAMGITQHFELFKEGQWMTMESFVSEEVLDIPPDFFFLLQFENRELQPCNWEGKYFYFTIYRIAVTI